MRIRPATEADLPFLLHGLEANRVIEGRAPDQVSHTPEDLAAFRHGIAQGWVRIAENEAGDTHGFLFFRTDFPVMYFRGPFLWIDLVFVAEAARGLGVGKALYEDAANQARQQGIHSLVLDVFDANTGSLAFHDRMGFERVYGIFQKRLEP
jgi:predicted GNAT superfamily acetyltransferase